MLPREESVLRRDKTHSASREKRPSVQAEASLPTGRRRSSARREASPSRQDPLSQPGEAIHRGGRSGSPCRRRGSPRREESVLRRGKTHFPSREKRLSLEKKRAWAPPSLPRRGPKARRCAGDPDGSRRSGPWLHFRSSLYPTYSIYFSPDRPRAGRVGDEGCDAKHGALPNILRSETRRATNESRRLS